ncbi:MAG TPA: DNA ligase D [Polyangiales bacterium]|nr:DNA ligase D [Polyangiales bacterium]
MAKRDDSPPHERSPLGEYRQKRDPGRTNEPFAAEPAVSGRGPTRSGTFVVHEHHASRRHFDLRLEVGGVLLSFSVPRGPTLDPGERRLAVQTEDHPLEYLDFEGVIPDQNYGAGAMIVWDTGHVRYPEHDAESGLASGDLKFELAGYKLRGRFGLVRTRPKPGQKQPHWILLKKRDAHVAPGSEIVEELPASVFSGLPASELASAPEHAAKLRAQAVQRGAVERDLRVSQLTPMAAAARDPLALNSPRHVYELKLDGVRILAEKRDGEVALYYRKGRSATASYPELVRTLRALPNEHLVLDGEVVAYDANGRPDFQRLAQRFSATRPHDVKRAMQRVAVSYVTFDLLALDGLSLLQLPLLERKRLLAKLVPARGPVRALDHIEGEGEALFDFCRDNQLEGVIEKRADSAYQPGPKASGDWCKIKCEREADCVVIGFTRGNGARELGAIDLATYDGETLISRGKVGSGIDDATQELLLRQLSARTVEACAAEGELIAAPRGRSFVRPELVVSIRHSGFTHAGHFRHPVFRGLRADVAPSECTASPSDDKRELVIDELPEEAPTSNVKISNPTKLYWPADGITKGQLCGYYQAIAPVLLPHLRSRPVILVRYPDGIDGKSFYQWNAPRGTPSWVKTLKVQWADRDDKEVELFLIDDLDTLIYVANLGCIPLHILGARTQDLAAADFLTVDFDLNGQPLAHAITLARALHTLLDQLGLAGHPKTSGQTGLHVLVPLGPGVNFDTARTLAELLGRLLVIRHADLATMERAKIKRPPKVYVDTGQTGTLRAIVAPYSVRAYRGARVSTPLTWDEVGFALDPARFTIATVPERVAALGDPMADLLAARPNLAQAIERLAAMLPR